MRSATGTPESEVRPQKRHLGVRSGSSKHLDYVSIPIKEAIFGVLEGCQYSGRCDGSRPDSAVCALESLGVCFRQLMQGCATIQLL